jgi:hypothetical protein
LITSIEYIGVVGHFHASLNICGFGDRVAGAGEEIAQDAA